MNLGQYVCVVPAPTETEPQAHRVVFKVGVQSFDVGGDMDNREHAEWFAGLFVHALGQVVRQHQLPTIHWRADGGFRI